MKSCVMHFVIISVERARSVRDYSSIDYVCKSEK